MKWFLPRFSQLARTRIVLVHVKRLYLSDCWSVAEDLKRLDFTLGLPEMRTRWYHTAMTVTLAQIHEDPAILDRAIASQETLEIVSCGELAATLMPRRVSALEQARQEMARRFAAPDWSFTVGIPLTREERNARSWLFIDTNILL
jgi:hypothetical protein